MSLIIQSIDNEIQQKSLLKHKFYQLWSAGSLSMADLQGYSKEYFQLVQAVPSLVSSVLEQARPVLGHDNEYAHKIKHNLEEEKQHIAPWISFAEWIGVPRNALYEYKCSSKTGEAIMNMSELTSRSFASGVSALYTFEKQLPEISAKKIEGLVNFYGVKDDRALEYFRIHQKVDIEHSELWRQLLECLPVLQQEMILDAASRSLSCQNMILDGVCDTYLTGRNFPPNQA